MRKVHWTTDTIAKLQAEGRIVSYSDPGRPANPSKAQKMLSKASNDSKEKSWLKWQLEIFCRERNLKLIEEFHFDKNGRKWRFDFLILEMKLGIEYNGIFSDKSRHTTATGYSGDMDKLNAAQAQGYKVVQVTPLNYKKIWDYLRAHL